MKIISQNIYSLTMQLLKNYTDPNMPPLDYLQQEEKLLPQDEEYDEVVELFLFVVHHKEFLADVTNYFYCLVKRRDHSDQNSLMILTHLIISVLNDSNKEIMADILLQQTLKKTLNFLKFFNRKSIVKELFLAGCQYFDEDYVEQNIAQNVRRNQDLLQDMLTYFEGLLQDKEEKSMVMGTQPVGPSLGQFHRRPPRPPNNTPQIETVPPPKPVPRTTYKDPTESKKLLILREKHKRIGLRLLEAANKAAKSLPAARGKQHVCPVAKVKKPAPPPRHKIAKSNVAVKKNATTILREACLVIKEEEQEIQRVTDLLSGAANHTNYEELLEQVRADEEQARLEDIERKHLLGLLTHEEAILAKQSLIEANKAKKAQIDLERKETEEILKEMRQKHSEKIREMVEKIQQTQKNIAEKKKTIIIENQKSAQEVADTNRQLYEKAVLKHKAELEKRIEIIKEIKTLARLKAIQENRFDPTETMNLGLLCEMSLTELSERLLINRANMKEEIERRQRCIKQQKLKQQQFLADTENFIQSCKEQKKAINTMAAGKQKLSKNVQKSQDIVELREKLEKARLKRLELKKNVNCV